MKLAHVSLFAVLSCAVGAAGCSPVTLGAHAILPSQAVDTQNAWIYLHTNDKEKDGIYRCYDTGGEPVCKQARLVGR